ncbi:DUF6011 domain-containing protein [Actinacidiphila glaucinigra]|uniref:DUF6011 domain-containing protein n=1 Tax=Actinacidiphila glaucinigra TaxID=235986 RepID=UPI00371CB436
MDERRPRPSRRDRVSTARQFPANICRKCWRPLKSAASRRRGYGPECSRAVRPAQPNGAGQDALPLEPEEGQGT